MGVLRQVSQSGAFTDVPCDVSLTNATDAHVLLHLNSGAVSFRAALSIRHPRDEDVYEGHKTFIRHSHAPGRWQPDNVKTALLAYIFIFTLLFTHQ